MTKKKFIKVFVCAAMAFLMAVGIGLPIIVSADTKSDYRQAQDKLNQINKELESIKSEKKKQEEQKKNAETQLSLVKSQISILNGEIETASRELTQKQQDLDNKKLEIQETDELFKERLKAMYMMRNSGTLSTVLGANTYAELLTASDTLQRISVADTDLLKYLDRQRQIIRQEEAELQTKLDELNQKQANLQSKTDEYASLLQTINSNLSDTEAKEQRTAQTQSEVYREYVAAKEAMEKEIAESGNTGGNTEYVGGDWIWPVPTNSNISSGFGWRVLYGVNDYHTGIDISTGSGPAIYGKAIVASNSGTVVRAQYSNRGYGNCIMLDHGGGNYTLYGHCSSLAVGLGTYVTQGQVIAYVGSSGNSTGPHLHFEIRMGGSSMSNCVDPAPYVQSTRP